MKFNYLLLLCSIVGFSQAEASHWYFGNGAGLIFDVTAGTVTPTADAASTINTNEGCSSISDVSGNLLFYTDGRNVWDKTHTIMPNADYDSGFGLLGDPSSTSSGLIVPKPGNPDQYYIFTVDEPHHQNAYAFPNQGPADENGNPVAFYFDSNGGIPEEDDGYNNGFAYSLVDLTLNGGNGDVVSSEKNVQLTTYNPTEQAEDSYKCSEKITAVEHADGQSYWVLTHFRDQFYAFRIDNTGVNTNAVISTVGPLITELGYRRNGIGYMKASPDGSKIVVCHRQNGNTQGQNANNTGSVWLYDFDNSTGQISTFNAINLFPNSGPYGVEFSPDSSKVYVSVNNSVVQFDISDPDPATTQTTVYNGFNFIGAIQLGPDGKIYVANSANSQTLDVINAPDELGFACDYDINGQPLANGTFSNIGLPPFIQSFFLASINVENSCVGSDSQFNINSSQSYDSIVWDFGDGIGTSDLDNPTYSYNSAGIFTVSAEITVGNEVNTFTQDITISETPIANPVDNLLECDDNDDGILSFDFINTQTQVLGTQDPTAFTVTYHANLPDAQSGNNPLSVPYQNTNPNENIFIRIQNNANTNCFDTTAFSLTVFDSPTANPVPTVELCDTLDDGDDANGQSQITLTDFDTLVLDGQDETLFDVTYHLSLDDAEANANPISSPYYNTTAFSYPVFVRIENNLNTNCFDTTEFTVNVYANPTANPVDNLLECDDNDDGVLSFDFINTQTQVLGTQDPTAFTVTYHANLPDAQSGNNPLSVPYQNTNPNENIFIRIQNNANTNCFDTTAFSLTVFDSPTANPVPTVELCDTLDDGDDANGQSQITLTDFDTLVLDGQDETLFDVTYHLSLDDAEANANPISSPYYNTTAFSYPVFVRIENNLNTNCFDTTEFTVNVNPIPQGFNSTLIQCDEDGANDGLTTFNLNEANTEITNGGSGLSTKFFLTLDNAENSIDEISAFPFINTENPQIVYAQVIDDVTGCFDVTQISLEVSLTSGSDANLSLCDDDGNEDGFRVFTLSDATPIILSGLPADYILVYYETYQDALIEQNPLPNNFTNTEAYNQTIYARIENNNQCYGVNQLDLTVFELPQLQEDNQTFFCIDSNSDPVTIDSGVIGNPSDYNYQWSSGQSTNAIDIDEGGTYTVTVTNNNGCSQSKSITIVNSNVATINDIIINDVSSNNTVTILASGEGDYEYALDDEFGPYQDDTTFYNVSPGFHTVYVRDKNGCGIASQIISVIGFPNFFTPNDDGYNDTWHVFGINTPSQAGSEIYIFDRYGKLLKQLLYNSEGWDGTYNGNPMPTSDYWFYIKLSDNRIFRGHFTLKR